jgi:hypothetical protein
VAGSILPSPPCEVPGLPVVGLPVVGLPVIGLPLDVPNPARLPRTLFTLLCDSILRTPSCLVTRMLYRYRGWKFSYRNVAENLLRSREEADLQSRRGVSPGRVLRHAASEARATPEKSISQSRPEIVVTSARTSSLSFIKSNSSLLDQRALSYVSVAVCSYDFAIYLDAASPAELVCRRGLLVVSEWRERERGDGERERERERVKFSLIDTLGDVVPQYLPRGMVPALKKYVRTPTTKVAYHFVSMCAMFSACFSLMQNICSSTIC